MEARLVSELPVDQGWQYEPKWDGFRAIVTRSGAQAEIMSKSGKSLALFFPELVDVVLHTRCDSFILDGEIILPLDGVLSFDALQARLHPAASRIAKLSRQTPAQIMLFDCLALEGAVLGDRPLVERRRSLEQFIERDGNSTLLLSPATRSVDIARQWLKASGGALDGVIAKRLDQPGERAALGVGKIDRGLLIEEVMDLMRRWWAGEKVEYRSERYDFQGIEVTPTPKQSPLELWLGGNGPKALERAGRLSDGWLGAFATPVEAGEARRTMQKVAVENGRHIDDEHFGLSIGYAHADIPEATFTMMKRRRVNQADAPAADLVPVGRDGLRDLVSRHIDNGISKFVLRPIDRTVPWHDELSWLADTVPSRQWVHFGPRVAIRQVSTARRARLTPDPISREPRCFVESELTLDPCMP